MILIHKCMKMADGVVQRKFQIIQVEKILKYLYY